MRNDLVLLWEAVSGMKEGVVEPPSWTWQEADAVSSGELYAAASFRQWREVIFPSSITLWLSWITIAEKHMDDFQHESWMMLKYIHVLIT